MAFIFFLVRAYIRKDAKRISGIGKPRKNGFPYATFFWRDMRVDKPAMPPMREAPIDRESPLWQAAEGMEANFLKEMLRNMRKTVQESPEMKNNQGYQVFRGMLDDHYAETAAKTQGIGLAELIVNQVLEMQKAQEPKPVEVREINKNDIVRE
jgi:flagellar protein FlgJ